MKVQDNDGIRGLTPAELEQVSGALPSLSDVVDAVGWAARKLGFGGVIDTVGGIVSGIGDFLGGIEVRGGRGPERPL